MATINKLSWGRKLAREAIRTGKKALHPDRGPYGTLKGRIINAKSYRKKYADMAREFKKKG